MNHLRSRATVPSFTPGAAPARQALTCFEEVRLAEAFETAAARFRQTGVFLLLLDDAGRVALHDEAADPDTRGPLLRAVRATGPSIVSAAIGSPEPFALDSVDLDTTGLAVIFRVPGCHARTLVATAPAPGKVSPELLLALASAIRDTVADHLLGLEAVRQLDGLTSQLADTYEELALLDQVTAGMSVNRSPEDFFRTLCRDASNVLGTACVGAALRPGRTRGNSLIVHGQLDLDPFRLARFIDETTELLIDRSTADAPTAAPLVLNHIEGDEGFGFLHPQVRQLLIVPLARDRQMLGFLFAVNKEHGISDGFLNSASHRARASGEVPHHDAGQFDSVDAKLLASVASASAVYAENALYYEDVHGLMMGLLHALTSAVDAKDSYTCGHSERVAVLSRLIAASAGMPDDEADRIYISGLLHDVGKIGVPEAVLQKSGKLTNEEFEQMKLHPQIGARILSGVQQVKDILPGVLHHHERFDGRGYPDKLAGKDIPLMGRIICLADSFDAMTTNRTYRRGMPLAQALAEIERCAGAQFDPDLAHIMLGLGADRIDSALESHRAGEPIARIYPVRSAQAA